MIRPPPRSPLFPYTPLFRAGRVPMRTGLSLRPDYGLITPWVEHVPDGAVATAGPDAFRLSTPLTLEVADGTVSADFVAVQGDRKSTRLNSSHANISYAVFCL